MLDRFEFLVGEAFVALRRNSWMTFAAITTAAMALFLLGGMLLAMFRLQTFAESLPPRFEMRVFLKDSTGTNTIASASKRLKEMPDVASVTFVDRETAWKQYKRQFPDMVEEIDNPLPNMFRIRLKDVKAARDVAAKISAMPEVETNGVKYLEDEQEVITQLLELIRWLGAALGGIMLVTAGVLIYNAIRMTIVARRREIRIMQLVGATRMTITTPMVIEGMIQGAIGGLLAAGLVYSAHAGIFKILSGLNSAIEPESLRLTPWALGLSAAGALYGMICSLFALREPKRVR